MGTNYYRVPSKEEMEKRKEKLLDRIARLKMEPVDIERKFEVSSFYTDHEGFEIKNPWDDFLIDTSVHLGKRSGGWTFTWNHNSWKYYSDKESLFNFIKSGRVVDEYGDEQSPEEFIKMALEWCVDGWTSERYLQEELIAKGRKPLFPEHYVDIHLDGLKFSTSTDFS
jgi:hypothetical protein